MCEAFFSQYLLINLGFTVCIVFCFLLPSKKTKFLIVYLSALDVRCFLNSFCELLEQKGLGDNDAGIPFSNGLVQNETK
jgi:hypothetical protein